MAAEASTARARTLIRERFLASIAVKQALLDDAIVKQVEAMAGVVTDALAAGGKILFCGNGGSAADATHLAAELVGRFCLERAPLSALSLSDNVSSVTAIGNDYGYGETYSRQVRGLGAPEDVLVALSTSGNSANVLAAVEASREIGMRTIALTGTPSGRLAQAVDLCVRIPSDDTARIQEGYMLVGHTVCEIAERLLFPGAGG